MPSVSANFLVRMRRADESKLKTVRCVIVNKIRRWFDPYRFIKNRKTVQFVTVNK